MSSERPPTLAAVSILIPCFNAERWVGGAIESALGQKGDGIEVIVLDDGSTDNSLDEILRYGDHVRWESGQNRGGGFARNRLLELAKGEWIQYLDADDYLEPQKIENQRKNLETAPDTDVLYSPVTIEHYSENRILRRQELAINTSRDPWVLLALWRLPQTGGPLWRRAALEAVGGWKEDQPCCQEHELYLRLLISGARFVHCPSSGAVYRRFANGTVSTQDPVMVRRERARIEDRLEAHLKAQGELTSERQHAINQARFDMARSAWSEDPAEALALHRSIERTGQPFRPEGPAAPPAYRRVYGWLGFAAAERIAAFVRRIPMRSTQ